MKMILKEETRNKQSIKIQTLGSKGLAKRKSNDSIPIVSCEERASAVYSLLLLLEHRDYWNQKDNFHVDWTDGKTVKWCITSINDEMEIVKTNTNKKLLGFGSKESSLQFLETFCLLIQKAKELI